jgi:3-hydroxyacyl-CoA dehydrogenase / enoyl-CoA hydratase / 3-hydroxybutyryl-CoA epimerase
MPIIYHKDSHNIVTLTLDAPGRAVNVINAAFGAALQDALEKLEAEKNLAGVIITSAKKTFMAGGDLEWLFQVSDPAEVFTSRGAVESRLSPVGDVGQAGCGGD